MAAIIHFDIRANNLTRAKDFYERLFDWKFRLLPGPMNYYIIETSDLQGRQGIGGGMSQGDNSQGITNFIGVASIDDSLKKVKELGGSVIQPKQALPGWGYLALCADTENNTFGLFQEDKQIK